MYHHGLAGEAGRLTARKFQAITTASRNRRSSLLAACDSILTAKFWIFMMSMLIAARADDERKSGRAIARVVDPWFLGWEG